jgi:uncharacterized Zn-binding protein involved in type VI secretion
MPAISLEGKISTGEGCFPPTNAVGPYTTTSFFNGLAIQLKGVTKYAPHTCGLVTHTSDVRITTGGSGTFFLEGKQVCRIGDSIGDGDMIAEGSQDTFIG